MNNTSIQRALFFSLLAASTAAFVWLIDGFLMPIFWSVVLAVVFSPVQKRWMALVPRRSIAAALTLASIVAFVFVPTWFVGGLIVGESIDTYASLSNGSLRANGISLLDRGVEQIGQVEFVSAHRDFIIAKVQTLAQTASQWLAEQALGFGQATFGFVAKFFLMAYILFFLLRDGHAIGAAIKRAVPLGDAREEQLFEDFSRIVRSIFKGTLLIALIQGSIGGALFYIAGIDGALLWAVVMTFLSVIPAIGPGLVWLPAGLVLLGAGAVWQGIVVLAGGLFIISLIDNVLRPFLMSRDVNMPDAVILVSILGGLSVFGVSGFVIGPVIAGLFFSLWRTFSREYPKA